MKTVHKASVPVKDLDDVTEISLPADALVLSVGRQKSGDGECLCLWYITDDENTTPEETRRFRVAGTGHPLEQSKKRKTPCSAENFLGTVQFLEGHLVLHVFSV